MKDELNRITISENKKISDVLQVIDENGKGMCFVIDQLGKLIGIITDGDLRRALINGAEKDTPITSYINRSFLSLPYGSDSSVIQNALSTKIRTIPLVDNEGRLVDYASNYSNYRIPVLEPNLSGNELNYITECIKTNWISSKGRFVKEFEDCVAEYCEVPYALACANGTVALHLALEALGITTGDEVIVPNLTFASTANAVIYTGATPVLADIEADTLCLDPSSVEDLITEKTKAIIPVHLYGHPTDMDPIMVIAKTHGLFVVEDCAEAIGSKYKNKPVGSFGDAAMFSFFGNKTITTGEGGMVLFKDEELYNKAAVLRDHGMSKDKRYWHEHIGYNYRMTNMQAAIGVAQMERIDTFIDKKRQISDLYREGLQDLPLQLPVEKPWAYNSYWLFSIILNGEYEIDQIMNNLLSIGIETRPIFYPLSEMPPYRNYSRSSLNISNGISKNGISLPSSPNLTVDEVSFVISNVREQLLKNHKY